MRYNDNKYYPKLMAKGGWTLKCILLLSGSQNPMFGDLLGGLTELASGLCLAAIYQKAKSAEGKVHGAGRNDTSLWGPLIAGTLGLFSSPQL